MPLDGTERETKTRNGRKTFMLSGSVSDDGTSTVQCRLVSRGEGWYTRQERKVTAPGELRERNVLVRPGHDDVVVTRIFLENRGAKMPQSGYPARRQMDFEGPGWGQSPRNRLLP